MGGGAAINFVISVRRAPFFVGGLFIGGGGAPTFGQFRVDVPPTPPPVCMRLLPAVYVYMHILPRWASALEREKKEKEAPF